MVPLKRIHDTKLLAKANLPYWRKQSTEAIIKSLRPGEEEPLTVKPDGRVFQGNTRIKVLQERGIDVDSLPRVLKD